MKKYQVVVEIIKRDIWEVESESANESDLLDLISKNKGNLIDTYYPHGDEVIEITELSE